MPRQTCNVLSIEELADAAGLGAWIARQFSRALPLLMKQGFHSMEVIAMETGFSDSDRMRCAFLRTLGQPPQTIRRIARLEAVAS
jgi:methylphosphotriester-DNA--protein-cysteine methyltransferase